MKKETTIDLDAYFERIEYTGTRQPTLETLQAIVTHHTQAIPFENLNPLLGQPVKLDLANLQEKVVAHGRGGYCFEQNGLFSAVLRALGYEVTDLAARVVIGREKNASAALTHQMMRIHLDGQPYMVDVGFGGMSLPSPIRLLPDLVQETTHEPYRLRERDGVYWLQVLIQGEWRSLYRFRLLPRDPIDYVVGNWYVSTHPASGFVTGLTAARLAEGKRYTLRNGRFSIHTLGQESQIQELTSVEQVLEVLQEVMRLRLPRNWGLAEQVQALLAEEVTSQKSGGNEDTGEVGCPRERIMSARAGISLV